MTRALVLCLLAACGSDGRGLAHTGDASIDTAVFASPAKSHMLFVVTTGITLQPASAPDATHDATPLVDAPTQLLPWRPATPSKVVVDAIEHVLDPYGVAVVDVRPDAGPYDMIVLTDSEPGTTRAVVGTGCNAAESDVAVVYDHTPEIAAAQALALFAYLNGVPLSATAGDCLHLGGTTPCALAAQTMVDPAHACADPNATMDERTELQAAFGSR